MNTKKQNLTQAEKKLFSRSIITVLTVSGSAALLFAFLLSPLTAYANSDGTISYLPDILDAVQWGINLLNFFICYGVTIFCIYRFRFSKVFTIIGVFSTATICKYLFNLLSEFFIFSAVPVTGADLKRSIASVAFQALAELLQYGLIVLLSHLVIKKHKALMYVAKRSAEKLNQEFDARKEVFPFKKLYIKTNPLLRSAFWASLIVALLKIASLIYYDIFYTLMYGLPTLIDLVWIIIYYSGAVLFAAIGYLIMISVFNKCDTKDLMLQLKYNK